MLCQVLFLVSLLSADYVDNMIKTRGQIIWHKLNKYIQMQEGRISCELINVKSGLHRECLSLPLADMNSPCGRADRPIHHSSSCACHLKSHDRKWSQQTWISCPMLSDPRRAGPKIYQTKQKHFKNIRKQYFVRKRSCDSSCVMYSSILPIYIAHVHHFGALSVWILESFKFPLYC